MRTDGLYAFDDVTRTEVELAIQRKEFRQRKREQYECRRDGTPRTPAPRTPSPSRRAAIEWQAAHDSGNPTPAEIIAKKYGVSAENVHSAACRLRRRPNK